MRCSIQRRHQSVHNDHPESDIHESPVPRRVVYYFDKVAYRLPADLSKDRVAWLKKHAKSVDQRRGHYLPKKPTLLTITKPDREALEFMASVNGALVNYAEAARDIVTGSTAQDLALADFAFSHFVQPYHSRRETVYFDGVTAYTGPNRPGHRFVWYGDGGKPEGRRRERPKRAFHMECRAHGSNAVRKVLKVNRPRDLIDFDHAEFWKPHLNYFAIDLERLGRYHSNKVERRRRKSAKVAEDRWALTDRRIGGLLFRLYSGPYWSVQQFVDTYGKGPYLHRLGDIPLICTSLHQVRTYCRQGS
jgi:hypothetical protein